MHYDERKISPAMFEQKRLDCAGVVKAIGADGHFAGYASVFDVVDTQRDVVLRGAFANSLKENRGQVKLLWQHQQEEPIGVFTKMYEDARGLYVEGKLLLDVARAKEAYSLLKAGALKGLSIGYSPVRYTIDPETGVRKLAEVRLWEVSLVTFPANEAAQVTVVKHGSQERLASSPATLSPRQTLFLAAGLERAREALRQTGEGV